MTKDSLNENKKNISQPSFTPKFYPTKHPIPKVSCYASYLSLLNQRNRLLDSLCHCSESQDELERRERNYNIYTNGANQKLLRHCRPPPKLRRKARRCHKPLGNKVLNHPQTAPTQLRKTWETKAYNIMTNSGAICINNLGEKEGTSVSARNSMENLSSLAHSKIPTPSLKQYSLKKIGEERDAKENLLENKPSSENHHPSSDSEAEKLLLQKEEIKMEVRLELKSNWGHLKRIAISRVEFFDVQWKALAPSTVTCLPAADNFHASPSLLLEAQHSASEPWVADFNASIPPPSLIFTLPSSSFLAFLKITNHSRFIKDSSMGVKQVVVWVSDTPMFKGEVPQQCMEGFTISLLHPDTSCVDLISPLTPLPLQRVEAPRRHSLFSSFNLPLTRNKALDETVDWAPSSFKSSSPLHRSKAENGRKPSWFEDLKLKSASRDRSHSDVHSKPEWLLDTPKEGLPSSTPTKSFSQENMTSSEKELFLEEELQNQISDTQILYGRRARPVSCNENHPHPSSLAPRSSRSALVEDDSSLLSPPSTSLQKDHSSIPSETEILDLLSVPKQQSQPPSPGQHILSPSLLASALEE